VTFNVLEFATQCLLALLDARGVGTGVLNYCLNGTNRIEVRFLVLKGVGNPARVLGSDLSQLYFGLTQQIGGGTPFIGGALLSGLQCIVTSFLGIPRSDRGCELGAMLVGVGGGLRWRVTRCH